MNKLTAGDLERILAVLTAASEPAVSGAPWHHQGIRIVLSTMGTSLNAIRAGQTTNVLLWSRSGSAQSAGFFLPHTEVADLKNALAHDADAPVTIARALGPINRKPSVHIQVGGWFEAFLGAHRPEGYPFRSLACRGREARPDEIETCDKLLAPLSTRVDLSQGRCTRYMPHSNGGGTVLFVVKPLPSIEKAESIIY